MQYLRVFRGINAAASLKHDWPFGLRRSERGLPRHQRRGLIEAVGTSTGVSLPCLVFRGINAAASLKLPPCDYADDGRVTDVFRGINAAASLKQSQVPHMLPETERCLPRHQRRGLIEASTPTDT